MSRKEACKEKENIFLFADPKELKLKQLS